MTKDGSQGCPPPLSLTWQIGKTVATIRFVKEAEEYLANVKEVESLRTLVNDLKNGKFQLLDQLYVEEFLLDLEIWKSKRI